MRILLTGVLIVLLSVPAAAQLGSVTYVWGAGDTIASAEANTNFSTLYSDSLKRDGSGIVTGATSVTGLGSVTFATGTTLTLQSGSTLSLASALTSATFATGAVGATQLASTTVVAASYGGAALIPAFTADADGRLTAASETALQLTLTSTYFSSLNASNVTGLNGSQFTTGTVASAYGGVPDNMVAWFPSGSCPSGWSEYTSARGRAVVGLPSGGGSESTAGTALSDQEDRAVGQHGHSATSVVTDSGHVHAGVVIGGSEKVMARFTDPANVPLNYNASTSSATTGITVSTTLANSGSVASTNAPYIQLITCYKG